MRFFTSCFHTNNRKASTQRAAVSKLLWVLLFSLGIWQQGWAQPTVLYTSLISTTPAPSNSRFTLNTVGGFRQFRFQSNQTSSVSIESWAFHTGTTGSPNYNPCWRPNNGGNTLSANTFIPTSFANGALYQPSSGGSDGLLPAITSGNYYTFNVSSNSASSNVMSLLETSFNPVTFTALTQSPVGANILPSQSPVITVVTSGSLSSGENVFVRYSTDNFVTSTIAAVSFTGSTGTVTLPTQVAPTTVKYYVFSTNKTSGQLATDVSSNGQPAYDMGTLNLLNNSNSNYSYTVTSNPVLVTGTGGPSSATYTTVGAAFTAINAGTHTGVVNIYVGGNTTETAVAVLNSSGAGSASYTFINLQPSADGVSITSNFSTSGFGVFELNGADNVTIDGDNPNSAGTNQNLSIINGAVNTTTLTSVIRLATNTNVTSCDNITIKNCILTGSATLRNSSLLTNTSNSENNSFGIYCGGNGGSTSTTAPTAITSVTTVTAISGTTINGLVVNNNTLNACSRAIVFNGAASTVSTGITITTNTIGASGVLSGSPPYTTPATTVYTKAIYIAGTNALTVTGNTIRNILSYVPTLMSGIELNSAIGSGTITISNNTITGIVQNSSSNTNQTAGIVMLSANGPYTISGNTISNIQGYGGSSTTQQVGISVSSSATSATIENNKISYIYNRNTSTFGVQGIDFVLGNNITLRNNFVSDINEDITGGIAFSTLFGIFGIRVGAGTGHKIYHNSVYLFGTTLGTSSSSLLTAAFSITATSLTGIDVRNNIFTNTMTGGTTSIAHVAMFLPTGATSAMNLTLNNNAYYTGATAGVHGICHAGTTYTSPVVSAGVGLYTAANFNVAATTPVTNLRNYSSTLSAAGTNDNASYGSSNTAPFISTTDLHLSSGSSEINNVETKGANLSVTTDIDGDSRTSSPDMGADEITIIVAADDAGISGLVSISFCSGSQTVQAVLKNYGTNTLTSAKVDWTVNGVAQTQYSFSGSLATGATTNITLAPAYNFLVGTNYTIVATSSLPNGVSDGNTLNDSYTSSTFQTALTGTINVGTGQTFTTLTAAVAAANSYGLCGATTFLLTDVLYSGSETFPITINSLTGSSSTNTLTIKANLANTSISGSSSGGLIVLNGSDYVTIDGSINNTANTVCPASSATRDLSITNTNTGTSSAVVWLQTTSGADAATNNTVKNCIITGNASTTTLIGLGAGSTVISTSSLGTGNNTNSYINNSISKVQFGIVSQGASTGNKNTGTLINQNIMTGSSPNNIGIGGIGVGFENNITISGNSISGITNTTDDYGINAGFAVSSGLQNTVAVGNECTNVTISKNIIGSIVNTGTLSSVGIGLGGATSGTSTISNNMVYGVSANATPADISAGILVGGIVGSTTRIYYNTVSMQGTITGGTAASSFSTCFGVATTGTGIIPTIDIKNNIFSNTQLGNTSATIKFSAIYLGYTSTTGNYSGLISTNNDLYCAGAGPGSYQIGITGGLTARTTLANWTTETGRDGSGLTKNVLPVFTSTTDLHLNISSNITLNASAATGTGVTDDIDCGTRDGSTPDIGADEFIPPANDAGITNITYPAVPLCSGAQTFVATIFNYGTNTLTSVTFNWQLNGGAVNTSSIGSLSVASGASTTTNFSVTLPVGVTANSVTAYSTLPNGATDGQSSNDSYTANNIYVALNGSYTVGATGADFTTLNATSTTASAVYYAHTYGICGASSFNLTSTYAAANETVLPISINALSGSSTTNTLTIKPASGVTNAIISGSVSGGAIIKLNGADNIVIDGSNNGTTSKDLTITNTNTTSPTAIWVGSTGTGSGATGNTIKNCIINTGSKAATSFAIFVGSATTIGTANPGDDNDNLTIQNNNITKAYYGIYVLAASTGKNDALNINSNVIGTSTIANSIGFTAIFVAQANLASVSFNDIGYITATGGLLDALTFSTGFTNGSVFNNKIHDLINNGAGRVSAIALSSGAGSASKYYNNSIYAVINNGSNLANGCFGFFLNTGNGYSIYYNSVNLTGDRDALNATKPAASSISAACYISGALTAPGSATVDIRNNIFVNSQTAATNSAPSYAIYSGVAKTAYSAIDYNDYYVSGAQGLNLGFLSSAQATIALWRTATSQDVNSINVAPVFTSSTDLHLDVAANGGIDNLATPIAGITTDIDVATRNTASPDMGADEFSSCGSTLFTWVGGTSTDWNLPANWCGGTLLPTSTVDVLIPGGLTTNYPSIFQTFNASVKSITIATGGSLSVSGAWNITVAAGGSFTNNGTFTTTSTGAVIFAGAGTVAGSATTAFKNITINGNLTLTKAPTISGDFTINSGAVSTTSPTYGASSKLIYNVTGSYTTATEWNAGDNTTLSTPGAGVPKDVTIQSGTVIIPDASGANRALAGILTIGSGTTLQMTVGTRDLYVGGNWVNNGGTFTANSRTVTMSNSSANQSFTGSTTFYNLTLANASNTVDFGSSTITIANAFSNSSGTMAGGTSTFIFTGATGSIIGSNAKNFYKLQVNNGAVITHTTGGGLIHVANDFTNNGSFTELNGVTNYTFYFDQPGVTQNLICGVGSTTVFGNLTIGLSTFSAATALNTGSSNFTIGGTAVTFNSNNSSITSTSGIVTFGTTNTGFCTISNASVTGTSISFYDVNITPVAVFGGVDFGNGISTINRNLTINTLGYVTGNAPKYVSTSTLIYNSTSNPYNVGVEWTGNATSPGFGIPQNVTISGTNNVTMPTTSRGMAGTMNINAGTLTLSSIPGSDLYIAGNWSRTSGSFVPANRAVYFNSTSADQSIFVTAGTASFDYLIINKSSTTKVLLNSTNVVVNGGLGGNSFELLNGSLDLNQQTFTYNTFNGSLNAFTIDGTAGNLTRNIISTGGAGTFAFTHADNTATRVAVISRKTGFASLLSFASNVIVTIGGTGSQNSGVDFGASLSTINTTLQINAKGYVSTNPPTYAPNSLLKYNIGATYLRFNEWNNTVGNPGYPFNVQVSLSGTSFVPAGTANAYAATALNMAGTLTIDGGCFFDMSNGNANNMTVPLNVLGDILINGTLRTSQSANGDIGIKGLWTNNGTFTPNSRKVTFDGTGTQSIGGSQSTGFYDLTVSNTVNPVSQGATVSVSNILALNNILSLNGNTLNLNGTITGSGTLTGSNASTLNLGGTGNSMGTLNFTSGSQLLNTISINRTGGTSADPSRVILGSSLAANNITLTNGIIVTGTNNLFTFNNSGGTLTQPISYDSSFIATCDASGTPLAVPGPMGSPFTGAYGFRINSVGNTNTFFPVGPTYLPAGSGLTPSPNRMMIKNSVATPDFTVVVNKGDITGTAGSRINRIWYVKSSSDTGQVDMRLYFTERNPATFGSSQDEVESGYDYSDIRLVQRDYSSDPNFISVSSGNDILNGLPFVNGTETFAQYTAGATNSIDNLGRTIGLTEFNRFSIANNGNIILPVTITNLRAALQNTSVALSWTSVSETNIDHYEVERSINGISFNSIGSRTALNNGSIKTDYGFLDIHPQSGDNYYRIKVVETDGRIHYTNVVLITTTGGSIQITIQPNPVKNGNAMVRFTNAPEGKYNLILYSNSGQKVWQRSIGHLGGSADYSIKLPVSIAKGIYFMHVENEGIEVVKKLMVE